MMVERTHAQVVDITSVWRGGTLDPAVLSLSPPR